MANMFDENGNYNKTEWKPGDRITAGKLNKIEESLEAINNNDIERHKEADERLDALEEQNEAIEERFDELEDLVADNKSEVDTAIYEVHSKMDRLEQEMNDGIDTVEAIAHTVDDKIDEVHEVAEEMEGLLDETKAFTTNAKTEIGTATENGLTELEDLIKMFDMEEVYKKVDEVKDTINNVNVINSEKINILSYSDLVVNNNWTNAVLQALTDAANSTCKVVFFPCGTYHIDPDVIVVPNDVSIIGASETSTTLQGPGRTNLGAGIQLGIRCTVSNLYIRDFEIGVKNTKYWNKIYDCKICNNTIGIYLIDSYICKIKNNEITFNGIGLLVERESYECIIKDNIIDNNNLGLGIYGSSNGLIISDNTIEGNRNYTTSVGCGILLKGNNHSRCKISGNWFEANGNTQDSVDVFLGAGSDTTHDDAKALWDNIVDSCVPDNYKSLLSSGQLSVGCIDLSNNAHIFTKYGILAGGYKCNIHIHDCYFKGVLDKYNKHIVITQKTARYDQFDLSIDNCNYENSDGMTTITPQVRTGVRGTCIHTLSEPADIYPNIKYNGEPLFVKKITLKEVIDNYNCIQIEQVHASGTSSNIPNRFVLISKGLTTPYFTNCRYSESNPTVLLGSKGTGSPTEQIIVPDSNGSYFFAIGFPTATYRYQNTSTWVAYPTGKMVKKHILTTGRFYANEYDGYRNGIFFIVNLTAEQYEKYFKNVFSVEITDIEYFIQGNIPTE